MIPVFTLCEDDPAKVAFQKWLEPQVVYYTTAEVPESEREKWTAVNTLSSGTSAHALAWTGDVPLLPDGFESQNIAHGLELVARPRA